MVLALVLNSMFHRPCCTEYAWRGTPRGWGQNLYRHPRVPTEYGGWLLEDGVSGKYTRHRHDYKGDGARAGERLASLNIHYHSADTGPIKGNALHHVGLEGRNGFIHRSFYKVAPTLRFCAFSRFFLPVDVLQMRFQADSKLFQFDVKGSILYYWPFFFFKSIFF